MNPSPHSHQGHIVSLLDTDLLKLTTQCAVLKYFPHVEAVYALQNRTPDKKLSRAAFEWLETEIENSYLQFFNNFRFRPRQHVRASFKPAIDTGGREDLGDVEILVKGLWVDVILYEIPLLALTSEAYFRFVDTDWNHDGQKQNAYAKGMRLLEAGCTISEYGTRRRRDFHIHELFGITPKGTVGHEWFMGIAAMAGDYKTCIEKALAPTDTFETPFFLDSFRQPIPEEILGPGNTKKTFAEAFTGVRHDSGDPVRFMQIMRSFYDKQETCERKTLYKKSAQDLGLEISFVIGTYFTNDF
ncbi:Quinolinate phosphoribosyl transferase [Lasiosphaeris hirsuta]|uniref:nicotinate phosphoribosyltransferase n=1 Tax=Lasiosphaeris hirsuta TaxID=260670 RepID=A0AA40DHR5_9PEZI|nr:Quinolinate phosphoribosyl transferase [Lasiosphaeris hirsuta]